MAAGIDDPIVTVESARNAIKKLQLPPENYRISSTGGIPLKVTNGSWESRYIALLLLICNHLIHFSILITIFTRIDNAKRNYRKNGDFR